MKGGYQLTVRYKTTGFVELRTFPNKNKLEEAYSSLKRMQTVDWVRLGDHRKPGDESIGSEACE